MLAAIGLLIIAKQLPLIFGSPGNQFEAHEFWGIVRETPSQFMHMDPKVFFLGMFCLALIFALASIKARWVKVVPPQVIAAVVGLILGWFLGLSGDRLILYSRTTRSRTASSGRISPRRSPTIRCGGRSSRPS